MEKTKARMAIRLLTTTRCSRTSKSVTTSSTWSPSVLSWSSWLTSLPALGSAWTIWARSRAMWTQTPSSTVSSQLFNTPTCTSWLIYSWTGIAPLSLNRKGTRKRFSRCTSFLMPESLPRGAAWTGSKKLIILLSASRLSRLSLTYSKRANVRRYWMVNSAWGTAPVFSVLCISSNSSEWNTKQIEGTFQELLFWTREPYLMTRTSSSSRLSRMPITRPRCKASTNHSRVAWKSSSVLRSSLCNWE